MKCIGGHIDGNYFGRAAIDPIVRSNINFNTILYIFPLFLVEYLFHNSSSPKYVEAYLHGEMVEGWLPVATKLLQNLLNLCHFGFHYYCWVQNYNVNY